VAAYKIRDAAPALYRNHTGIGLKVRSPGSVQTKLADFPEDP
jgi:hypothetical protein